MSHVWHKNLVFCKKAAQSAVSEEKQAFTAKIESGAPPAQGRRRGGASDALQKCFSACVYDIIHWHNPPRQLRIENR